MGDPVSSRPEIPPGLADMASGFIKTQALYVAAKLGLADHVAAGPVSSGALAQRVGADGKALYRLLRALESMGLFHEPRPGFFALTNDGMYLRKDAPGSLCDEVIFNVELTWRLWGELAYTVKTGNPADRPVYGTSFFGYLQDHPDAAALFNEGMTRFVATMVPAVVASYDFSPFHTIVDVGGGQGILLAEILKAHSRARGVVFDLPVAVEGARRRLADLSPRVEFIGGDFFAEVPAGDAIILSAIISDWDDEKSIRILSACRRAIADDGRLLLLERLVVPDEPAPPTAFLDLAMLVFSGGTGRSEPEYRRLLTAARFELIRVVGTGTQRSIFEAKPI